MTGRTLQQGTKVNYTDANGAKHEARVDYVWERSDNKEPLVNLSFVRSGEDRRTVATSVPYEDAVKGASGYFWLWPDPKTHRVTVHADPGDFVEVENTAIDHVSTYRVPDPA